MFFIFSYFEKFILKILSTRFCLNDIVFICSLCDLLNKNTFLMLIKSYKKLCVVNYEKEDCRHKIKYKITYKLYSVQKQKQSTRREVKDKQTNNIDKKDVH